MLLDESLVRRLFSCNEDVKQAAVVKFSLWLAIGSEVVAAGAQGKRPWLSSGRG